MRGFGEAPKPARESPFFPDAALIRRQQLVEVIEVSGFEWHRS
jgi:hypothetical protein